MTNQKQQVPPQPYLEKWDQMIVEKNEVIGKLTVELAAFKAVDKKD